MKNTVATIFLFLFSIVAVLPLVQQIFKPIKLAGLQGAFDGGEQPAFSIEGWIEGTFQSGTDQFLKYNTAFNGELVRLRNQLDYSLFGNINTILTLGKENYIYDPNYILSREGKNLVNDKVKIKKETALQETIRLLDSLKIPLIVLFAPNKANYFPEYLPVESFKSELTNKKIFAESCIANGARIIDFDIWFEQKKSGSPFPLIPKYGAHWSTYGAAQAGDSLLRMLSEVTNKECSSFKITGLEMSEKPRFTDDDYLASLNLMQKFQSPQLAYPVLEFNIGYKPNVLIISDSFIWNLYDLGIVQNCFNERSSLWYYQKTKFDIHKNNLGPLTGKIELSEITEREVVIILTSDPGLTDFGYGFLEQVAEIE